MSNQSKKLIEQYKGKYIEIFKQKNESNLQKTIRMLVYF